MVAVISPTRFQSRVIHGYLRGALTCTPILKRELVEDKRESFTLKNGINGDFHGQPAHGSPFQCDLASGG